MASKPSGNGPARAIARTIANILWCYENHNLNLCPENIEIVDGQLSD
jgi:hypothetical protein